MYLFFLDVDGTLTDGKIHVGENGEIFKSFNVKDGYIIHNIFPKYDIVPVIITGRESIIVKKRCEELGIEEIHQGCTNKKKKMLEIAERYGVALNEEGILINSVYMGDDIPDLECMLTVEISGCPADSVKEIKDVSKYVCRCKAGDGAVREFADWLIETRINIE